MNPRGTEQRSNHHGGLHMTEQFKLVTNAQESNILKSNVTNIKIQCSNNFPRPYRVEITNTSWEQSENFTIYTSEKDILPSVKITLHITHSDWSSLVTHTVLPEKLHSRN